jgi:hypothetical protein
MWQKLLAGIWRAFGLENISRSVQPHDGTMSFAYSFFLFIIFWTHESFASLMLNRRDILCMMNLSAGHEKLFLSEHANSQLLHMTQFIKNQYLEI